MLISGVDSTATTLLAGNNANLTAVIQIGGPGASSGFGAVLQDVVVDGNKSMGGTSLEGTGAAVQILRPAENVDITRVTVQNSNSNGLAISYTSGTKLDKLMAINNRYNGLRIDGYLSSSSGCDRNANDVFITMSAFENNGESGVVLNGAGAMRVSSSDFGGNKKFGIYSFDNNAAPPGCSAVSVGGYHIITGNQFGNNTQYDLVLAGTGGGKIS
jgi:hypothetical protein